jgi:transcriptional regulator with XRE-family HTH domain
LKTGKSFQVTLFLKAMNKPREYTDSIIDEIFNGISKEEFELTEKKMLLAVRIGDAIKARGWQKQDLARALHKRPSEISKWLSGTHNFTTEILWEIEKVLNVELISLHENEPEETITIFKSAVVFQLVANKSINWQFDIVSEPNDNNYAKKGNLNKEDIQLQLKTLELIDFSLSFPQKEKRDAKVFYFNINIEHKINKEKKLVFVIINVNVFHEDKETNLGSLKTSCNFEITDIDKFCEFSQPDKIKLPLEIIETLNSISLSTTRGVMFSQFKGTFLHNAVLPVIDPKVFKTESKKI